MNQPEELWLSDDQGFLAVVTTQSGEKRHLPFSLPNDFMFGRDFEHVPYFVVTDGAMDLLSQIIADQIGETPAHVHVCSPSLIPKQK